MNYEPQLSHRQQLILTGILRDVRGVLRRVINNREVNNSCAAKGENSPATLRGNPSCGGQHGQRRPNGHYYRRIRAAKEGLAAVNLWRWLGRTPSNVDHVLCHRDLLRLEKAGLLKRQAGRSGRRTTHVKLTTTGHQIARRLLAEQDALANETDGEAFDIDDFPMLPLDWPMEAQAEPGEPTAPASSPVNPSPAAFAGNENA